MCHTACDVERKALQEVAWTDGLAEVRGAAGAAPAQVILRTFDGPGIERVNGAELVLRLEPQIRRFLQMMGTPPAVQMFRYVGTDGEVRQFLWCGQCGGSMICAPEELERMHALACRGCGAKASPVGCQSWHSFGRCNACPAVDRPS